MEMLGTSHIISRPDTWSNISTHTESHWLVLKLKDLNFSDKCSRPGRSWFLENVGLDFDLWKRRMIL
jgi:hypothetical protein